MRFSGQTGKETLNYLFTKKPVVFRPVLILLYLFILRLLYFETYIFNRIDCFRQLIAGFFLRRFLEFGHKDAGQALLCQ